MNDIPSNSGRTDVDAVLEAKEELINDYLDRFTGKAPGEDTLAGLFVMYVGGTRYDFVEVQLRDPQGDDQHYLRVRASGTEPINRIYVESSSPEVARRLMATALKRLEELSAVEIRQAGSGWRLADILSSTTPSPALIQTTRQVIDARQWRRATIVDHLKRFLPGAERRTRRVINGWLTALGDGN